MNSYESKMEKIQAMEMELSALKKELESEQKVEFTMENFRDKKIAVHCKTKEDSNIFLAYLTGKGVKWNNGRNVMQTRTEWDFYTERTCYSLDGSYEKLLFASNVFYEREGYKIIDFTIDMLK